MSKLDRKINKIRRRNSKAFVAFLVIVMLSFFALAVGLRYYAFEPVVIQDSSMSPRFSDNHTLWMCKLPHCMNNLKANDVVWAKQKNGETVIRRITGLPGETVEISDKGRVRTESLKFRWRREDAFIKSRRFYVPAKGDTLHFSRLNDVEQDYFIALLNEYNIPYGVKVSLWQGDHEISTDYIGSTKIANRQVSMKEIHQLPWQDRFLIERQIAQSQPGNATIQIRRELFNPKDSSAIETFLVEDDCFFITCEKGSHCFDSREYGYFTKDKIIGKYIKEPDLAKDFVIKKVKKILKKGEANEDGDENKNRQYFIKPHPEPNDYF